MVPLQFHGGLQDNTYVIVQISLVLDLCCLCCLSCFLSMCSSVFIYNIIQRVFVYMLCIDYAVMMMLMMMMRSIRTK